MPRFFVEVPHENTREACDKAIEVFRNSGSHFLTNAEWGCHDGEHKAWFMLELDDKETVKELLPPLFRRDAKIVEIVKFNNQTMVETKDEHKS
jgi:hypothetical protein